jgi:hypothetical protein
MAPRDAQAPEHSEVVERTLPSGRTLVLRIGSAGEDIEIRSAGGDLDLRITLTDAGPVVALRSARVEVDTADVAFRCRDFDVQASGTARFAADELRAETKRDIHLNGAFIRLNCTPEGEAEAQALMAQVAAQQGALPAAGDPCGALDASHPAAHPAPPEPSSGHLHARAPGDPQTPGPAGAS